jgi:DNA repair protein RecO (recombination protein O)
MLLAHEGEQKLYSVLLDFLQLMQNGGIERDLLVSAFELKLLSTLGFGPILDYCLHCSREHKEGEERIAAASGQAGYLCDKHFSEGKFSEYLVPDTVLKLQRYLLLEDLPSLQQIRYDHLLYKRVRSIQRSWIEGVVETSLKSAAFLDRFGTGSSKYREIYS